MPCWLACRQQQNDADAGHNLTCGRSVSPADSWERALSNTRTVQGALVRGSELPRSPQERNSCVAFPEVCLVRCERRPICDKFSGHLRNLDEWLRDPYDVRTLLSAALTTTGQGRVGECGCRG